MKNIFLYFSLGLLALASTPTDLKAQATAVATREFDADDWLSGSMSLKEQGMLLFGWEEKGKFALRAVNQDLEDYATWSIATENRATLVDIDYYEAGQQVLVLIHTGKREYELSVIDLKGKKKKTTTLSVPDKTYLRETIHIVGDNIWFVGYSKKASFLYKCSIKTPRLTPLDPHITEEKYSIGGINVLTNNEVAVTYFYGPKKKREMDALILSESGKTVVSGMLSSLEPLERQQMIDASVTRMGDGDYAITGTYNKKGKGIGNGVYFARYSDSKVRYFSNFDYSDFEHFYDHLSDKSRDKAESKIAKKKEKGKNVTISSLSIMHKTLSTENGLVFIGEYYYPTYRYETYYVNGKPQTRRVFDGYQYTHGMAVGIDHNGKKLYDLSIPMHITYKPMVATRFLRVSTDSNIIHILHTSGRRIHSSKIEGQKIANNEYSFINKIPEKEKEKWSASSSIYWYENYYFVMEVQKTKEKGFAGKRATKRYAVKVEVRE